MSIPTDVQPEVKETATPILLGYESRRRKREGKPPYSETDSLLKGLICVVIGLLMCVGAVKMIVDILAVRRFWLDEAVFATVFGSLSLALLGYGVFVLWMHGRSLRRLPTFTAWEAAGRLTRRLIALFNAY